MSPGHEPAQASFPALDPFAVGRAILGPSRQPLVPSIQGYEVLGFIAEGGLGQVWRARCAATSAVVAVKIPHNSDPELSERLVVEAETLKSLRHPAIVGFQELVRTRDGRPALVMDLVDGPTLAASMPDGGFDLDHALQLYIPVLDAMAHAHGHGIVHRDLKPTNILIDADGAVKVSDFGLARPVHERRHVFSMTRSGAVAGTVEYLAPECYQPNYTPAPPADLFALGVLLYELLTGAPPRGAWKPPSQLKRLDIRLDELISETIDPDPARRPASVRALHQRLEEIRRAKPLYAGTPLVNCATRAADFAWTTAGLYFCIAGFCTVLAMTRTPVPGAFNLTYKTPGLLIGGWLAVWTLSLAMGILWIWQLIRLWRFRRVPLREALPSPFGARLGTSTTAAILVAITQFLCAWMPVVYAVTLMGLSFQWRNDRTHMWDDALVVVRASDNQPVSPWTWDPIKMFDGGAYRLEETQTGHDLTVNRRTDKTSFYTFIQPALIVLSTVVIGLGMLWTGVRWIRSWWARRRLPLLFFAVTGGSVAFLLIVTVAKDWRGLQSPPLSPQHELQIKYAPELEKYRELVNQAFKAYILHDGNSDPKALNLPFQWDRLFTWPQQMIQSSQDFADWRTRDQMLAHQENRHHQAVSDSHGEMIPRTKGPPIMTHRWYYVRFTEPPGELARSERVWMHLNAVAEPGHDLVFVNAYSRVQPIYAARPLSLSPREAEEFLHEFAEAMAEPEAPRLIDLFSQTLGGDGAMRYRATSAMGLLRAERGRWHSFSFPLKKPLVAPVKLPGARWRVEPVYTIHGTLPGSSKPAPPVSLRFTFDLAHVEDRWRIVAYWFHGRE